MATINYAIQVTTDETALSDATYGLQSGVFRFITGRPSYDGSPTYPTGEAGIGSDVLEAVWYEGWITADGLGKPKRTIDVTVSGDYGNLSGFDFNILGSKGTDEFWQFLEDNSIYLVGRAVQVFTVIDGVFYYLWNGVVSNNPTTDTEHRFACDDQFRKIHRDMPPSTLNDADNPNIDPNYLGSVLPLVFGSMNAIKLQGISEDPQWLPISSAFMYGYNHALRAAPLVLWDPTDNRAVIYIGQLQMDNRFKGDLSNLVGKFLFSLKSEDRADVGIRINRVQFPSKFGSLDGRFADLILDGNIGLPAGENNISSITEGRDAAYPVSRIVEPLIDENFPLADTYWWVRAANVSVEYQLSDEVLQLIDLTEDGYPILYYNGPYGLDLVKFDTPQILRSYDPDRGTLKLWSATNMGVDTEVYTVSAVPFSVQSFTASLFSEGDPEHTIDYDRRTSYRTGLINASPGDLAYYDLATWTIAFADYGYDYGAYDSIQVGIDVSNTFLREATGYKFKIRMSVVDALGNLIADKDDEGIAIPPVELVYPQSRSFTQEGDYVNFLPNQYYTEVVFTHNFPNTGDRTNGEDSMFFQYTNSFSNHNGTYAIDDADDETVRIFEGLTIPDSILDSLQDGIAMSLQVELMVGIEGENTTTSWAIKQFAMYGVSKIPLTDENLYVAATGEYDTDSGEYNTQNVYGVFRHILEAYDGIDAADIDYHNLESARSTWLTSRNVTQVQNSYNYLKELCRHSYVSIIPLRTGKRRLTAWLDDVTTVAAFDESNIVRGTLKALKYTPMNKAYTNYIVTFNYTDSGGHRGPMINNQYTIQRTDEDAFPALDEDWRKYVGGFSGSEYADAKDLWGRAHQGYLRMKSLQSPPVAYTELKWYPRNSDVYNLTRNKAYNGQTNAARLYLWELVNWCSLQKSIATFSVPMSVANTQLELLDPVTVEDAVLTDGPREGYITKITSDLNKNRIQLKVLLKPYDYVELTDGLIIERGKLLNVDTITERADQGDDTITETGVV